MRQNWAAINILPYNIFSLKAKWFIVSFCSQKCKWIPQNQNVSPKQCRRDHLLDDRLLNPKLKIWVNICQMWACRRHSHLASLSAFCIGDKLWCKKRDEIQTKLSLRLDMSLRGHICLPMFKSQIPQMMQVEGAGRRAAPACAHQFQLGAVKCKGP